MSFPAPKANAKPQAQNIRAAIAKFTRIFATTVPAFLPRENPISRNAKPACMNITSTPATITQTPLMPTARARSAFFLSVRDSSVLPSPNASGGTMNSTSIMQAVAASRSLGRRRPDPASHVRLMLPPQSDTWPAVSDQRGERSLATCRKIGRAIPPLGRSPRGSGEFAREEVPANSGNPTAWRNDRPGLWPRGQCRWAPEPLPLPLYAPRPRCRLPRCGAPASPRG